MLSDMLKRVFDGSAVHMVATLLETRDVDQQEVQEIKKLLAEREGGRVNTESIVERLDGRGSWGLRYLLSALWQSSILLRGVWILSWFLRRCRAAVRHMLWAGALLLAPFLPLLAQARPPRHRGRTSQSVSVALEGGRGFAGNQGEVWGGIREMQTESGAHSPTDAMRDVYEDRADDLGGVQAVAPQTGETIRHGDHLRGEAEAPQIGRGGRGGVHFSCERPVFALNLEPAAQ